MIIDGGCVPKVVTLLKADDFYSETHREIYATIISMFNFGKPIDPVTVDANMRERGIVNADAMQYLIDLMNITPTAANVLEYAKIVRDSALLRQIADAGTDITGMASSGEGGAESVLDASERRIYALRQGRSTDGLEPVGKILTGVFAQITDAGKLGSGITGIPSGLADLDNAIMGLNKADLILIASRPSMGKTSIALNIALNASRVTERSVAIFSLEMSREQLALRLLSSESCIDGKRLQTGRLSQADWAKLLDAAARISKSELLINDNPSVSVADMNAQCRRVPKLGLVIIDYLQLMQSAGGRSGYASENRTQVVSDISRMLKIMAKELNVPVICLSQLSRANEARADKRPVLSDMRESGAIEQDADVVLGLYREGYYNPETEHPNTAELIILKNRRGETGKVFLHWSPELTLYSTLERHHDDDE
jgi:replicative DNA helicase